MNARTDLSPSDAPFGFYVGTLNRKLNLFAADPRLRRAWLEALSAIRSIPSRPLRCCVLANCDPGPEGRMPASKEDSTWVDSCSSKDHLPAPTPVPRPVLAPMMVPRPEMRENFEALQRKREPMVPRSKHSVTVIDYRPPVRSHLSATACIPGLGSILEPPVKSVVEPIAQLGKGMAAIPGPVRAKRLFIIESPDDRIAKSKAKEKVNQRACEPVDIGKEKGRKREDKSTQGGGTAGGVGSDLIKVRRRVTNIHVLLCGYNNEHVRFLSASQNSEGEYS